MLRNYLAAALNNLVRNRLYAAINILGLAVGLAAAILVALFAVDEFSYDRWIPGARDVYRVSTISGLRAGPLVTDSSPPDVAGWLRLDYPQIQAVARLMADQHGIRRGQIEANEPMLWADPDIFTIFPLPTVTGDLKTALTRPDAVVLSQAMARKYFGRSDLVGQILLLDHKYPMRVTAVIKDLPSNTHLTATIFASAKAPFSPLAQLDAMPSQGRVKPWSAHTYFRLRPGSSVKPIADNMPAFIDAHMPGAGPKRGGTLAMPVMPITAIHFAPRPVGALSARGDLAATSAIMAVGVLIVLVAAINFVNLTTARAARRAVEVGVRKLAGAGRRDLVIQFIGESVVQVALGALAATALAELLLPTFNAFLGRGMVFDYRLVVPGLVVLVLVVGVLAGSYPGLILSAFRPATVLKGGLVQGGGSRTVRQGLVALQFAVLIGLIVATVVIYRQTVFATRDSLRLQGDQMLLINAPCANEAFKDRIAALPGVKGAACSMQAPLAITLSTELKFANGRSSTLYYNPVGFGFFELYGLKPLAGRFFARAHGADLAPQLPGQSRSEALVVNETAVRDLGFASPTAAVGKTINWSRLKTLDGVFTPEHPAQIIGVVPDFPMGSIRKAIEPAAFYVDPSLLNLVSVALRGRDIPETLKAIDGLWAEQGRPRPITRSFFDQRIQTLYRDVTLQGELFAVFSAVALFIACLGLFGLAAFTTERRTKEIGIRKALGASRQDIVKLFLWQFTQPVLWANLIAWPLAFLAMDRWLHGFAYRIELTAWPFVAASLAALVIAWLTVAAQTFAVAGAKPIGALRYE